MPARATHPSTFSVSRPSNPPPVVSILEVYPFLAEAQLQNRTQSLTHRPAAGRVVRSASVFVAGRRPLEDRIGSGASLRALSTDGIRLSCPWRHPHRKISRDQTQLALRAFCVRRLCQPQATRAGSPAERRTARSEIR